MTFLTCFHSEPSSRGKITPIVKVLAEIDFGNEEITFLEAYVAKILQKFEGDKGS